MPPVKRRGDAFGPRWQIGADWGCHASWILSNIWVCLKRGTVYHQNLWYPCQFQPIHIHTHITHILNLYSHGIHGCSQRPRYFWSIFSWLICRGEISDPSKVVYYLPMGWSNHDFIGKFIAIVAIKLLFTYIYHYLPIIGGDPGQNTTPRPGPGLAADSSPTATAWTVAVRECEHHHGDD